MSEANLDLVERFCNGLAGGDMAPLLALLDDDVYYHNMPWQPITGAANVRDFLQPFLDGTHSRLEHMAILHQAASGDVVLNARSERWRQGDIEVVLPVAGVFTVHGDRIVRWEDYFDSATMKPILDAI